jgi:hypothetical protein
MAIQTSARATSDFAAGCSYVRRHNSKVGLGARELVGVDERRQLLWNLLQGSSSKVEASLTMWWPV